jgi:hypothetical protein
MVLRFNLNAKEYATFLPRLEAGSAKRSGLTPLRATQGILAAHTVEHGLLLLGDDPACAHLARD